MLRMAISAGQGRQGLAAWARALPAVDFVLIREKALAAGELVLGCREVLSAVAPGTRVLVAGGRVDVALAAALHGVHLGGGAGELRVTDVCTLMPEAWVSVSCHTLDEVRQAREDRASAALFAPVFGKRLAGRDIVPGIGLELLQRACAVAGGMPVLALGGITEADIPACMQAGAAGIAGIGMFTGAA